MPTLNLVIKCHLPRFFLKLRDDFGFLILSTHSEYRGLTVPINSLNVRLCETHDFWRWFAF